MLYSTLKGFILRKPTDPSVMADVGIANESAASVKAGLITREIGLLTTLGEVQASPTANTLLDRTKTINTTLGTILTALGLINSATNFDSKTGSLTETAPASDTASSGLNGRLQRIAQRLTSLIALHPTALGAGGGFKIDGSGTALPVTDTGLSTLLTTSDFDTKAGSLTETAPASDTASSGLNGRLQRIAQRLTSMIALLPTALGAGGGLKVDGSGTALPVTNSALDTLTGAVTETAPASDTASSGLNGRLQRIAQRITSMIALLPTALGGSGGMKVEDVGAMATAIGLIGDAKVVDPNAVSATSNALLRGILNSVLTTSPAQVFRSDSYVNLTNSGSVKATPGTLSHIECGAAGTTISISVYDSLSGSGTLIYGPRVLTVGKIDFGCTFAIGCYITFSATTGTPNLTAFYR